MTKNKLYGLLCLILIFFGFIILPFRVMANELLGLKTIGSQNLWTLILTTSAHPLKYRHLLLSNPSRLMVTISNTRAHPDFNPVIRADSPITSIRYSSHKNNELQVIFDLVDHTTVQNVTETHQKKGGDQLIIHLIAHGSQFNAVKQKIKKQNQHVPQISPADSTVSQQNLSAPSTQDVQASIPPPSTMRIPKPVVAVGNNNGKRPVMIVIDPGHGGKDPGAIGRGGTKEKVIVLGISKDLQQIINQQPGFKAVLTRDGDYYLTLRERLVLARKYKADMFVAIHADMYRNSSAQGATVFALSQRGATSEAARWLAAKENESELLGGADLSDKGYILKSVLLDLSQSATIQSSLDIGHDIIQSLSRITHLHHVRVEQAAFVVLKSPDIPSLLVETGFLSNPYEEQQLQNAAYRHHLALSIMQGIHQYFYSQPPQGTWLSSRLSRDKNV